MFNGCFCARTTKILQLIRFFSFPADNTMPSVVIAHLANLLTYERSTVRLRCSHSWHTDIEGIYFEESPGTKKGHVLHSLIFWLCLTMHTRTVCQQSWEIADTGKIKIGHLSYKDVRVISVISMRVRPDCCMLGIIMVKANTGSFIMHKIPK